ncbi:hypothetical protein T02_9567 [Trichinella nativa]|uniref:Uncharacterized protein n=1 Tax=Trichinella nativa TaxID=6335 RepID=A0A0V1LIY6_9BILA|nr:hypothetical protein T02_9567 [Trichinella nativa]
MKEIKKSVRQFLTVNTNNFNPRTPIGQPSERGLGQLITVSDLQVLQHETAFHDGGQAAISKCAHTGDVQLSQLGQMPKMQQSGFGDCVAVFQRHVFKLGATVADRFQRVVG